ncbi:MAG: DUF1360 domain-containing protein [Actinomycetota bacterium]|nr:DUF1360 domain-containing protein [Actinomycetota bacterium]
MSDGGPSEGAFEEYKQGEDIPLLSYGVLAGAFNLVFAVFLLVARLTGKSVPERIDATDIALLGMATHKVSLVGSQDAITSPLRAPFTELREKESPKKVDEKPRGEGLRRSVGELLTCKFCLSVWVASLFTYGLVLVPRVTRLVAAMFAVVTVSDHLHQAYKVLMKEASG